MFAANSIRLFAAWRSEKMPINQILCGDALEVLKTLPDESVNCCVTSPPYFGLRDYGVKGLFQITYYDCLKFSEKFTVFSKQTELFG